MRSTATSLEELGRRLADLPAYTTIHNSFNYFDVFVPTGSVVHWAAQVKPELKGVLDSFTDDEMKELTFSDLKRLFPAVYNAAISGLNFVIRSGGKV